MISVDVRVGETKKKKSLNSTIRGKNGKELRRGGVFPDNTRASCCVLVCWFISTPFPIANAEGQREKMKTLKAVLSAFVYALAQRRRHHLTTADFYSITQWYKKEMQWKCNQEVAQPGF